MKNWSVKNISGGTMFLISIMIVNLVNFIFNAFLGRVLSFEEFGLITLFNTFLYIAFIPFNALYATINYKVAYFTGQNAKQKEQYFFKTTLKKATLISLAISAVWVVTIPLIDTFFRIDNYFVPLFFTPMITLGAITAINKGFLQGKFRFHLVGIIITIEALTKLLFAWVLLHTNFNEWVYLSIPISAFSAFVLTIIFTSQKMSSVAQGAYNYKFPKKFFNASLLAGSTSMAFLTFDLLLVKHFLPPSEAGQYALLSLIGKMVYFFGVLPSALIITSVGNDEGKNRNPIHTFYKLFVVTITFSVAAFAGLGLFGGIFVPMLLGSKVQTIMPYLTTYSAAIMCYAIASSFIGYHIAKRQYIFAKLSVAMAVFMSLGIVFYHVNIGQITSVIFWASVLSLIVLSILHILEAHVKTTQTERWFKVHYE